MNILVISKRQYTGRDLIDDQYGRLYCIPHELSLLGNTVDLLALSYRKRAVTTSNVSGINIHSLNGLPFNPVAIWRYAVHFKKIVISKKIDVVWISSDLWHVVLGGWLCKRFNVPYAIDFYDNYYSFGLSKFPFLARFCKTIYSTAIGFTVVTESLLRRLQDDLNFPASKALVLGNAADNYFVKSDKLLARQQLGLPKNSVLIGTAGALFRERSIH